MQASAPSVTPGLTLNQFFSASEARNDRWRALNRVARGLAAGGEDRSSGLRIFAGAGAAVRTGRCPVLSDGPEGTDGSIMR